MSNRSNVDKANEHVSNGYTLIEKPISLHGDYMLAKLALDDMFIDLITIRYDGSEQAVFLSKDTLAKMVGMLDI